MQPPPSRERWREGEICSGRNSVTAVQFPLIGVHISPPYLVRLHWQPNRKHHFPPFELHGVFFFRGGSDPFAGARRQELLFVQGSRRDGRQGCRAQGAAGYEQASVRSELFSVQEHRRDWRQLFSTTVSIFPMFLFHGFACFCATLLDLRLSPAN